MLDAGMTLSGATDLPLMITDIPEAISMVVVDISQMEKNSTMYRTRLQSLKC